MLTGKTENSINPLLQYIKVSRGQLLIGILKAKLALANAGLSQGQIDFSFIDEIKIEIAEHYNAALQFLTEKPDQTVKLKDVYAFWLASIENLFPYEGELSSNYESRLGERQFDYAVVTNRISLDF